MHADAHFVIGQAHTTAAKPCQDYATAGDLPDGAYAIVADGCSSGGATDVGARLVALAAVRGLQSPVPLTAELAAKQQTYVLAETAARLGLVTADLLATCLSAVVRGDVGYLHLQGDGVVAWQYTNGDIEMVAADWDDNTPCYPAYAADGYASFVSHHGGDLAAERWSTACWRRQVGELTEVSQQRHSLAMGLSGLVIPLDVSNVQRLAVFSDGVTQVEGWDWPAVVVELMSFKAMAGSFVKRRLSRFVRDTRSAGRGPIDDIAYAAIDLERRAE